jgi:hypothetical protein
MTLQSNGPGGNGAARELQNIWQDGNSPRLNPPPTRCKAPKARALRRHSIPALRQALVGDQATLAALPEHSPRRRPTLPRVSWLEREDRWENAGDVAAEVLAGLHQRRRP